MKSADLKTIMTVSHENSKMDAIPYKDLNAIKVHMEIQTRLWIRSAAFCWALASSKDELSSSRNSSVLRLKPGVNEGKEENSIKMKGMIGLCMTEDE